MSTARVTAPVEISDEERERRAREVAEMRHSGEMEGLYLDDATAADTTAYADGTLDLAGLRERIEARYPRV